MFVCSLMCIVCSCLYVCCLCVLWYFFFFKQKTAYEMRISDWSSDVCSSDLPEVSPISEQHPQLPVSPYGDSKRMVETILRDYARAYGLHSVSLRYFNAAGASSCGDIGEAHHIETHLVPLILEVAAGQRAALSIYGADYPTRDGTCLRDYVHVSDLADAHVLALQYLQQAVGAHAFNLGHGQGATVREVLATAGQVTGRKIPKIGRAHV